MIQGILSMLNKLGVVSELKYFVMLPYAKPFPIIHRALDLGEQPALNY